MNRRITQQESEQLFEFCKKHYVEYYDLQIELVDHLASAIEEQWKSTPDLSFNDALKNTFGKFGITGFSKIKEQKQKELRRKYDRLLWKFFIEFYKLPKVIMTFVFTIGLYTLFQLVSNIEWLIYGYLILALVLVIFYFMYFNKNIRVKTLPDKKFKLIEQLNSYMSLITLLYAFPNFIFQVSKSLDMLENTWFLFGFSFFMVALIILVYGYLIFIPKKIKEHFMEYFAEFAQ